MDVNGGKGNPVFATKKCGGNFQRFVSVTLLIS
jgi:hypothetical protein